MKVLSAQEFKELIYDYEKNKDWKFKGSKPTIIDFYADWCGPCRMLSPILEDVQKKYAGLVDIYKVDTEASPEVSALFGIRGIPSILFIHPQEQPAMVSGVIPREGFDQAIEQIFNIKI